jgi:hypothetical protein
MLLGGIKSLLSGRGFDFRKLACYPRYETSDINQVHKVSMYRKMEIGPKWDYNPEQACANPLARQDSETFDRY